MKKHPVIGIVPSARLFETDDIYRDSYDLVNNYTKRTTLAGGLAVALAPVDAYLNEEQMDLCDAFVITGGARIWPYHIQVVEHCVKTGKRLLGICLGLQAIHVYFLCVAEAERRNWKGSIPELFDQLKKERYMYLHPVEHHWDVHIVRGNEKEAKRRVNLTDNSHVSKLLGRSYLMGATMHRYAVSSPEPCLTIGGLAEDGTIEVLEYGNNIIGVQFHPEVDNELLPLFRFLTDAQ